MTRKLYGCARCNCPLILSAKQRLKPNPTCDVTGRKATSYDRAYSEKRVHKGKGSGERVSLGPHCDSRISEGLCLESREGPTPDGFALQGFSRRVTITLAQSRQGDRTPKRSPSDDTRRHHELVD